MKMIFFNNDTSMGQRKILSPRRESNPESKACLYEEELPLVGELPSIYTEPPRTRELFVRFFINSCQPFM